MIHIIRRSSIILRESITSYSKSSQSYFYHRIQKVKQITSNMKKAVSPKCKQESILTDTRTDTKCKNQIINSNHVHLVMVKYSLFKMPSVNIAYV